jgi:hypothetical protein
MKKIMLLLLIGACAPKIPESPPVGIFPPVETPVEKPEELPLFDESHTWPKHSRPFKDEWRSELLVKLQQHAPHLLTYKIVCPKNGQHLPIMDVLRAMIYAESGNNPNTVFMESSGHESIGLFQLSYVDGKTYRTSVGDLKDPMDNINLAMLILGRLTRSISNEPCAFYRAAGRYWATLRTPECWNPPRLRAWGNFTKELGKCL